MAEYDGLLRRLAELADLFDEAAETFPPLYHELLLGGDGVRPDDWPPFVGANTRPEGDWQHFEVIHGGRRCARFSGFDDGLDEYTRLAGEGYDLLAAVRRAADGGRGVPDGFLLNLPEPAGVHGWTGAVHSTARSYATARLFVRQGDWDRTGWTILSEDERWVGTGVCRRLAHPAYEALGHDVFTSSAEAVRLWLDPGGAVRVGWDNEKPEIILPGLRPLAGAVEERPQSGQADGHPVWNSETRELWVGPFLVRRYRLPADNQCLILAAFQESGWPTRIDNPIPPGGYLGDPPKRLRDTILALNRHHATPGVIRFEADGTGEGIICRLPRSTTG